MSDSAGQLAALRAEMEALKAGGPVGLGDGPIPVPTPATPPALTDSAKQLEALKAEMAALQNPAPSAPAPVPTPAAPAVSAPPPAQDQAEADRQLQALKAEMAALKGGGAAPPSAEPPKSAAAAAVPAAQPAQSDSARQLEALRAEMAALKAPAANPTPAPTPTPAPAAQPAQSESARQLEELRAEMAALKGGANPAPAPAPAPTPTPTPDPTPAPSSVPTPGIPSESTRQLEALRAEMAALKEEQAKPKQSESARQLDILREEMAALKAQQAQQAQQAQAPPPAAAPKSESQRQLEAMRAEMAALRAQQAQPPAAAPMSESQRQLEAMRAEMAALRAQQAQPPAAAAAPMSESQRQLEAMRAEMEALRRGQQPPPPGGHGGAAPMSESQRQLIEMRRELEMLRGQQAPGAMDPVRQGGGGWGGAPQPQMSESDRKLEAMRRELAELRQARPPGGAASVPGVTESDRQLQLMKEEMRQLQEDLATQEGGQDDDSDVMALERDVARLREEMKRSDTRHEQQRAELDRLKNQTGGRNLQNLQQKEQRLREELARREKGLDLCLVMDATASMGPYIQQAQERLLDIFAEAERISGGGEIRIAFIAYRDYEIQRQFEYKDFCSGRESLEDLKKCVRGVVASSDPVPGGRLDFPEDVAGAFEQVKKFSWKQTTRLIFHVADAPCHGRRYHGGRHGDNYPDGDPKGYNPEDSIRFFARNRIDYYFLKVNDGKTSYTDTMTNIFIQAYRSEVGEHGMCQTIAGGKDPRAFVPAVVKSLTASCTNIG